MQTEEDIERENDRRYEAEQEKKLTEMEEADKSDEENYIAKKVAKSDAEEESSARLEAELI